METWKIGVNFRAFLDLILVKKLAKIGVKPVYQKIQ
jgi:hypothetical protein